MNPSSFSVKGVAAVTFKKKKEGMTSSKIWNLIAKVCSHYPDKVQVMYSSKRGSDDKRTVEDPLVRSAISDMIDGCIETCEVKAAVGQSMNLLLGSCYEYRVPLGTRSVDTGHETILLSLPFPMAGCYVISSNLEGSIKKDGEREHYMVSIELDIYINNIDMDKYNKLLSFGMRVYPFKLNHPSYYTNPASSDSEPATDTSEGEGSDHSRSEGVLLKKRRRSPRPIIKKQRKSALKDTLKKVIAQGKEMASSSRTTEQRSEEGANQKE
ncbi:putative matrix protein [Zhuye pepper nucleorhabdovirus]|uniref:Matrix protein n=1 Tax=Zhuye pepper nucleorhabdovirus TaxID=2496274 RepID=A0A4P2V4D4_9RHAB|nr:putative matrix protein [Green Sichuan pepper nucleorhabdovirus]AZN18349.1 putative matrix protein [Zhuye pepper nucleorhabdovirus]